MEAQRRGFKRKSEALWGRNDAASEENNAARVKNGRGAGASVNEVGEQGRDLAVGRPGKAPR